MQQPMYHPDDLASMDPLVLMKNLDHVRMTSRRLSYILQGQVHLYRPEANELRMQIDQYVEAERASYGVARRALADASVKAPFAGFVARRMDPFWRRLTRPGLG